ncbi:MAG: DinB family protein [Ardenticatenaceae bacterium]|nr:DinB family protein [Ardenticatenaceae bacterium]
MAESLAAWRNLLLARLAGERAHLLFQYRSLAEEVLTAVPVSGELTAKEVLLHVAAWDAVHSERLSLVLDGRAADIQPIDSLDQANARMHGRFAAVPLEQALATCLKERSGFLALLKRTPDEVLHRRITLPWGKRIRPRTWARWRWQNDAHHARDMLDWRQAQPPEQVRQIGPKAILRAQLKATRREILSLVDVIPPAERTQRPVCGVWTMKDLIGHLTDWELVGVNGLQQLAAGQTPEFDHPITNFDEFNAANAAARLDQSWDEVWAEFTAVRQNLLDLFDQLPEVDLRRSVPAPWGRTIPAYVWMQVWMAHDHEHAVDVRHALALSGWPRYLTHHK